MLVHEFEVIDKYFSEEKSKIVKEKSAETSNIKLRVNGEDVTPTLYEIQRKSYKTDEVNGVEKNVGAIYQLVATGLKDLGTSETVDLIFPAGTVQDTKENTHLDKTITAAVDQTDTPIIVDFEQPVWTLSGTVAKPETVDSKVEITIVGTDKYLNECTLAEVTNENNKTDINGVEILVGGQKVGPESIERKLELVSSADGTKTYKITLSNFTDISGELKVNILANTLKDVSTNGNDPLTITVGDVDFVKPVWNTPTNLKMENGTVSFKVSAYDQYLNEASSILDGSNIELVLDEDGDSNTITTTLNNSKVENGTFTADIVLSNFGTYSGPVTVKFPAGTLKDNTQNSCEGLTYKIDLVDFIVPEWKETVTLPVKTSTIEITLEGTDKNLNVTDSGLVLENIDVLLDNVKTDKVTTSFTTTKETITDGIKYVLKLENLDQVCGNVKVVIPGGSLKDTAETPNVSAQKTIDLGTVDVIVPELKVEAESVVPNSKTIELSLSGSDKYLVQTLTAESAKDVQVYLDGATEANTTVTKTLTDINYTDGKVTAKLVLGNFGDYKGTVKVVFPEGFVTDTSDNKNGVLEYTTAAADFKKPEWKDAKSTIFKDTKTVEVYLEGTDDALTESLKTETAQSIEVYVGNETVANTSITKTLKDIKYTPEGDGVRRTKVTATLVLGNIEPNSGTLKVLVPAEVLVDASGNKSEKLEHTTAIVDFVKPTITNFVETQVDNDTLKYTFDLTEKYLDSAQDIKFEENDVLIELDGTDITSQITKSISYTNGAEGVRNYTITVSGFYAKGLSGKVKVTVNANAVTDQYTNSNDKAECQGTTLIDTILPEFVYEYSGLNPSVSTSNGNSILTIVFSAEDKYLDKDKCILSTSTLGVTIDGETVPDANKSLKIADKTQDGKIVYSLDITLNSNTGTDYAEFSGIVNLSIPGGAAVDQNTNQSLTKSIAIKDATDSPIIFDKLKPEWKVSGDVKLPTSASDTVVMTLVGTDRYLDYDNSALSTTGEEALIIYLNGNPVDASVIERTLTRNENLKDDKAEYGISYTLTLKAVNGFDATTGKIKVGIPAGTLNDKNLNSSEVFTTPETNLIDFKAPVWTEAVTLPVTTSSIEITLDGTDEFLNTANSGLTTSDIKVLVDGTENATIKKSFTTTKATITNGIRYVLKLENLDKISGEVKVEVKAGTLKDTANPANTSAVKTIDLGLVDQNKPTWSTPTVTYPTTKNEAVTITFVGTDRSLDYTNSQLSLTGENAMLVYFGNEQIVDETKFEMDLTRTENQPDGLTYTLTLTSKNGFDVDTGKVKVEIPAGALKDQASPTANVSDKLDFESNLIDFKDPVWTETVTTPVTSSSIEITLDGTDEYLNTSASGLTENNIHVLLDDVETDKITKSFTTTKATITNGIRYVLKLDGLDKVTGPVKVKIDGGTLKDTANPVNVSEVKEIDLGIVDIVGPIWDTPTNLVNENGTVSFTISAEDRYLSSTLSTLSKSSIVLDLEGDAESTTTIKVDLSEPVYSNGKVTADVTLTEFGTYSGEVIVRIPTGTLKDDNSNNCNGLKY